MLNPTAIPTPPLPGRRRPLLRLRPRLALALAHPLRRPPLRLRRRRHGHGAAALLANGVRKWEWERSLPRCCPRHSAGQTGSLHPPCHPPTPRRRAGPPLSWRCASPRRTPAWPAPAATPRCATGWLAALRLLAAAWLSVGWRPGAALGARLAPVPRWARHARPAGHAAGPHRRRPTPPAASPSPPTGVRQVCAPRPRRAAAPADVSPACPAWRARVPACLPACLPAAARGRLLLSCSLPSACRPAWPPSPPPAHPNLHLLPPTPPSPQRGPGGAPAGRGARAAGGAVHPDGPARALRGGLRALLELGWGHARVLTCCRWLAAAGARPTPRTTPSPRPSQPADCCYSALVQRLRQEQRAAAEQAAVEQAATGQANAVPMRPFALRGAAGAAQRSAA